MLEEIQKYIKYAMISYKLSLCIDYCNIRDDWSFINEWNSCIADIENLINDSAICCDDYVDDIQCTVRKTRTNIADYMLCANIIEEEMLPLIYAINKKIEIDLPDNEPYELLKSKSGLFNVFNNISNKYMHSMNNPMHEALRQAEYLYRSDAENIIICGAGLGYLAYQLWKKSYKSAHVYIFEKDQKLLELAQEYGVLSRIDEDYITIKCESDEGILYDSLYALSIDFDQSICWVSDYFIDNIDDESIRAGIKNFSDNIITRERFRLMDSVNIRCNKTNTLADITVLKNSVSASDKEYIVVAAGPSLDYSIEYIKKNRDNKKIVAVESALRKLLINDIRPDYVAVLDPTELIMKYIDGIEDESSESILIAHEKAYWKYVDSFLGKKYRVALSESVNNTSNIDDIQTSFSDCTTVSSLAIEIALYLGAESIDLVGLDLSYPNNKIYAGQISDISKVCTEAMVRSVDGTPVGTSYAFIQFKAEIEEIIRKSKAKFYNLSKDGAFIQGTLMNKWWEKKPTDFNEYIVRINQETTLEWNEKYYILWQLIRFYIDNNCAAANPDDNNFWSGVANLYGSIEKQFVNQIDVKIDKAEVNEKYVVLITSYFSDESDEISDKIRNDAYNLKNNHGFEVLIVNTGEYMGGKKVALEKCEEPCISEAMTNSEAMFYMGERFPFFSFEDNMPDISQTKSFIEIISKRVPISFISYDPFSLVASACKLIGNVEYR